jgi:hypothetical protein
MRDGLGISVYLVKWDLMVEGLLRLAEKHIAGTKPWTEVAIHKIKLKIQEIKKSRTWRLLCVSKWSRK